VYNFVLDNSGKKFTFDACIESLKESPRFTYKKDMEVTYLAGSPLMIQSDPYYIGRKRKKGKDKDKPGKGKKIFLAPVRGAFLSLVALNVRGLASKLQQAIQKDQSKTKAFWTKLGGDFDKLQSNINKGAKKKALFGKGKGLNGATNVTYLEQGIGAVDWAAVGGFIATASPALIAAATLFKTLRVPEGEGDLLTEGEKEKTTPLDPNGEGFEAADPEPGAGSTTGILTTGFKPSPLMVGAIGLGVLGLLYFTTKKRK